MIDVMFKIKYNLYHYGYLLDTVNRIYKSYFYTRAGIQKLTINFYMYFICITSIKIER